MEPFLTPARRWESGLTRIAVYLLPDLERDARLATLLAGCRHVISRFPFLAPVEHPHVTVHSVVDRRGVDVSTAQRDQLAARLTAKLCDTAPFRLLVGSPLCGRFSVLADIDGDLEGEPFHTFVTRVRAAVGGVLGEAAGEYDPFPPHMALAHAGEHGDPGPLAGALRRVRPSHAVMSVDRVWLVELRQDLETVHGVEHVQYRWSVHATIPLGGPDAT